MAARARAEAREPSVRDTPARAEGVRAVVEQLGRTLRWAREASFVEAGGPAA